MSRGFGVTTRSLFQRQQFDSFLFGAAALDVRKATHRTIAAVGDKKGRVGIGQGKANEVPDAMKKAVAKAKKSLYKIPLHKGTIPHEIMGIFGAGKVLLKPAGPGTGVIAGGGVRPILELAGVQNILTKCIGSSNAINVVKATMVALMSLKDPSEVARMRERAAEAEEKA